MQSEPGVGSTFFAVIPRVFRRGAAHEIWAVTGGSVGHVGRFVYGVPYIARLQAENEPTPIAAATAKPKPKVEKAPRR